MRRPGDIVHEAKAQSGAGPSALPLHLAEGAPSKTKAPEAGFGRFRMQTGRPASDRPQISGANTGTGLATPISAPTVSRTGRVGASTIA